MTSTVSSSKSVASVKQKECVGCGTCIKACSKNAIIVPKGIYAVVDTKKCIGCGLCLKACPASVIELVERKTGKIKGGAT